MIVVLWVNVATGVDYRFLQADDYSVSWSWKDSTNRIDENFEERLYPAKCNVCRMEFLVNSEAQIDEIVSLGMCEGVEVARGRTAKRREQNMGY